MVAYEATWLANIQVLNICGPHSKQIRTELWKMTIEGGRPAHKGYCCKDCNGSCVCSVCILP